MVNNLEIPPIQDGINLLAAQLHQQPPPPNQLNNEGIDPNDGNDGVKQAEDVPIFVPSLMNVVDPPQLMVPESPILPFQLQLPEVRNCSILNKLCTLQGFWISTSQLACT